MENTEEKKVNYTLFWSGEEISTDFLSKYYENELDDLKAENILLGEFNSKGKYSFSQEVKKALVAVKKRIDEKNENSYFLVAKTSKNAFTFKMKVFEIEDKDLLAANLYIIEVVDDERFLKPIKTFVAQYVDKKTDEFLNKAKYVFNIVVEGEFNELERKENDEVMAPVLPKVREKNEALIELAIENLLDEILAELENCGEEGKKIKEEFEKETKYSSSKDSVKTGESSKPNYRTLKKKLDSIVEKHKGYEVLAQINPKIGGVIQKFNETLELEKEHSKQIEIMPDDIKKLKEEIKEEKKEEKTSAKPEAKKASGGKSGGSSGGGGGSKGAKKGGKKGGGGGGKKDKKKDSKKDPAWKNAVKPVLKDPKPVAPATQKPSKDLKDAKVIKPAETKKEEAVKTPMPQKRILPQNKKKKVSAVFLDDDVFSDDLDEMSKFLGEEKQDGKEMDKLAEEEKDKSLKEQPVIEVVEVKEEKQPQFDLEALEILQRLERNNAKDERTIR